MKNSPGSVRNSNSMLLDRLTSFFGAHYLEAVDVRLKGSPHKQLAAMVHRADSDILEVCAATGFLSRIIATGLPHARISALDRSAHMIAQGRLRAEGLTNIGFVQGDATAIPYPDSSFDVVLAAFGLSVLSSTARGQCLAEIHRVLKASGRLLVVDIDDPAHRACSLHAWVNLLHRRRAQDVSGSGLLRLIESRGFRPIRHLNGQGGLLPFQIIVARRARADYRAAERAARLGLDSPDVVTTLGAWGYAGQGYLSEVEAIAATVRVAGQRRKQARDGAVAVAT